MKHLTLVGLIALLTGTLLAQKGRPISVYVFTAAPVDGFTDTDSQRRADSVKDLQKELAKRKGLTIAESADMAQLVIEVIASRVEDTGSSSTTTNKAWTGILSSTTKDTAAVVRVTLSVPGTAYTTALASPENPHLYVQDKPWTKAAQHVAGQIERWVKMNAVQLK
jgi:hypothetical protein